MPKTNRSIVARICGVALCALLLVGGTTARAATTVGNHRNILFNGKPFYPVCVHHAQNWQLMGQIGFNCVLSEGAYPATTLSSTIKDKFRAMSLNGVLNSFEYSDYVRSGSLNGLNTIAQGMSKLPAFLNYVIDEPQYTPNLTLQMVQAAMTTVKANDPNHPTFIMGDRDGNVANGMNALADVVGLDDYPVRWSGMQYGYPPTDNLENSIGTYVDANIKSVGPNVPVMFAAQAHSIPADSSYPESGRYPTPQELRAMVYLALNHGAKGIFIYAMDDNYSGFKGFAYDPTLLAYMPTLVGELNYMLPHYVDGTMTAINTLSSVNAVTIKTHCLVTTVAVNPTARSITGQIPNVGMKTFAPLEVYINADVPAVC